jgi:ribosomal protein S12 methylthiotransferase
MFNDARPIVPTCLVVGARCGPGATGETRGLPPRARSGSPCAMANPDPTPDAARAPKVSFVSLGCPKALVDSERIITHLRAEGYELTRTHAGADLVVVNTCGFLDSAQAESLTAIGNALQENGKVIVTGCMGAEPEKITAHYPGVLAVTGPQQYESVVAAVHRALPPRHDPFLDLVPPEGIKLTPRHYAYLKISEGCNNRCSFCIIPRLRGDLVSRPAADVLREAERLVAAGVKELLVISQDTSAYGVDLKYAASQWKDREVRARFVDLTRALGELGVWVRLHYIYPYPHVDEVIPLMADGQVLPYLDIPFQHAAPAVLRRMKRPAAQEKTLERIARWRDICPDLTIRSTFIVGFPGETDDDFALLLDWLDAAELDRVGCFRYEPVHGALANELAAAVPDAVKEERWHRFMQHQQAISARRLRRKVGSRQQVIIDEVGASVAKGRGRGDAPDIDGAVYVASRRPLRVGEIATVRIERADEYDLHGTAVGF